MSIDYNFQTPIEVAMAIREGRQAIGFDVEEKYCQMSNDRIKRVLSMPELFV